MGSKSKINLLLEYGAKTNKCWMGDMPEDIKLKYGFANKQEYTMNPSLEMTDRSNSLIKVTKCRLFLRSAESKEIIEKVAESVDLLTRRVLECLNIEFSFSLSGSFAEDTKCFAPDEFDFSLEYKATVENISEEDLNVLPLKVYVFIDSMIRNEDLVLESKMGNLRLVSLLYGDKISNLHFLWTGKETKGLDITVDLAVCKGEKVYKHVRHFKGTQNNALQATNHIKEQQMIRDLPAILRHGFILAKAVRIASIAQPNNIETFDLQETIKTDDVISSFILKACLFGEDIHKEQFNECSTPHDVATTIYELLQEYLNDKHVFSAYNNEDPVGCSFCEVERGCCKRRKLMFAMVEKIRQWLKENRDQLQDIDFVDDVDLGKSYRKMPEEGHTSDTDSSTSASLTVGIA